MSQQLGETVNLVWAAATDGASGDFGQSHKYRGAFKINLATGSSALVQGVDKNAIMVLHAALMVAGWIFLLPLGTLFAKHKWVLGESKLFGIHWWFQNHRALQISGFGLFLGGMSELVINITAPRSLLSVSDSLSLSP